MLKEIVIVEEEAPVVQTGYETLEVPQKIYVPYIDIVIEMVDELLHVLVGYEEDEIVSVTIDVALANS